ncbi:MAG TPA: hypothetical protein VKB85_07510 [Propionibacteriaceae bacterium]|nr:hypothetical protein [Propionibacteriaceae bacterium]
MLTWLSNQWKRLRAFEKRNRYRGTVPRHIANEREQPADRANTPGTKDYNPGGSVAGGSGP